MTQLLSCVDVLQVAFERHPLRDGFTLWNTLRVMYLAIFAAYWLYNLVHCFLDLREAAVIKHFTQHRLGLSPRQLRTVTWPEVARRIVDVSPCWTPLDVTACLHFGRYTYCSLGLN